MLSTLAAILINGNLEALWRVWVDMKTCSPLCREALEPSFGSLFPRHAARMTDQELLRGTAGREMLPQQEIWPGLASLA